LVGVDEEFGGAESGASDFAAVEVGDEAVEVVDAEAEVVCGGGGGWVDGEGFAEVEGSGAAVEVGAEVGAEA
jgi:hypothetical protein